MKARTFLVFSDEEVRLILARHVNSLGYPIAGREAFRLDEEGRIEMEVEVGEKEVK